MLIYFNIFYILRSCHLVKLEECLEWCPYCAYQ